MPIIISTAQSRHKDSYAQASDIGLVLRANGEEQVKVIDGNGNVVRAGFEAPTVVPVPQSGGAGDLTANKWVAYQYVYAATQRYPFVGGGATAGGSDSPRSNPGDATAFYIGSSSAQSVNVQVAYTTRSDISDIWLYRTGFYATQAEAETAAAAGLSFYVNDATNDTAGGVVTINDNLLAPVEQVELDNYVAPQFAYSVYDGTYFWGFGNHTFSADCSYGNSGGNGVVTLTGTDTWFNGRDGQNLTVSGITSGGYDGQGTFRFKYLTDTTANVYGDSTNTLISFPSTGTGTVVIQGPATTLYRSKAGNPFGWGFTQFIGENQLPIEFGEKVGGGYGSAIALIPNEELLMVSTRYPSRIYSYNLGLAADETFFSSRRTISSIFGFTSNFSVFSARVGSSNVLRGIDYDNLEIIQCDGIRAYPVMKEISPLLRELTSIVGRQELAHGIYDPRTQTNCLWVTKFDSDSLVNFGIFEDAKTGAITIKDEHDLLSSATINDPFANTNISLGGTQTGLYGEILAPDVYSDWVSGLTGIYSGSVEASTSTTITRDGDDDFSFGQNGYVGNWCLFTDSTGGYREWARISAATSSMLSFDVFTGTATNQFTANPEAGWKFYVGMIECKLRKYFDFGEPSTTKKMVEQWLTMENADNTLVGYYRERNDEAYALMTPVQVKYSADEDGALAPMNAWVIKGQAANCPPSQASQTWGLEIVNRNYDQFTFYNTVIKVLPNS